ncbi:chaperonin 10-like protein [Hyaloraphidium curvatum]|nr:chaperonin 10-like protein [Hyaloraphidium curvatum]
MKGIVLQGPHKVAYLQDLPLPKLEKPTDAICKVQKSALCGSDLHFYHGRFSVEPGTICGHEFVGEITELGPEAAAKSGLKVGDRVGCSFATCCGTCFNCKKGLTSRCSSEEGALTFGMVPVGGKGLQGTQTEYVRVPVAHGSLVKVPDSVSDELALLLGDILSTGWYCAEMGGLGSQAADEKLVVAVVGCGPVAMMAITASRLLSKNLQIIAVDSVPDRLKMALDFGADQAVNFETEDPVAIVKAATEGRGADVVLEVVGVDAALTLSYNLVRAGGVISSVGAHTSSTGPITPGMMYGKNLTWKMGRCPSRAYFEKLLPLAAAGKFDGIVDKLVSHRMKLSEAERAYDIFTRRAEGCTKVIFEA